jgi:hypothetical protein
MSLEAAGEILTRLWLAGPLLYLGLSMAIDPDALLAASAQLSRALHRFQDRFHSYHRRMPVPGPELPSSSGMRRGVRLAGFVLASAAFLVLAGAGSVR